MTCSLADRKCIPCSGGVAALQGEQLDALARQLDNGWVVVTEHHLQKEFKFVDFRGALQFTDRVGAVAEQEGHHPEIRLSWGKVVVLIWTHKVGGLTANDFVLAAKVDRQVPVHVPQP